MGEDEGREEVENGDELMLWPRGDRQSGKRGANPKEASLTGNGNSSGKIIYLYILEYIQPLTHIHAFIQSRDSATEFVLGGDIQTLPIAI